MYNLNNIKIYLIDLNGDYHPDETLFEILIEDNGLFIGLSVCINHLKTNLNDCTNRYQIFSLLELDKIPKLPSEFEYILNNMIAFTGVNLSADKILDLFNDGNLSDKRRLFLESSLYYKSNQEGKKINHHKLRVKHYDDFHREFSEDIISTEILENNYDFSESTIILESYLTNEEINNKFIDFLI